MRSLETSDTFVIELDFADSEGSEGTKVVHIDNDVYLFPKELVEKLWIQKGVACQRLSHHCGNPCCRVTQCSCSTASLHRTRTAVGLVFFLTSYTFGCGANTPCICRDVSSVS